MLASSVELVAIESFVDVADVQWHWLHTLNESICISSTCGAGIPYVIFDMVDPLYEFFLLFRLAVIL